MHALGGADPEPTPPTGQPLDLVGPHPGAVEHRVRIDVGLRAGLAIPHPDSANPIRFPPEADDLAGAAHHSAVLSGRAGHCHGVPGVVGDRVVVVHPTNEMIAAQRRRQPQRSSAAQMPLTWH